jgi:hypothetical protein
MRFHHALSLFAFISLAGAAASARQPITFATTTIDPTASGDCKALADIDGDGKADPIVAGDPLMWYESGAGFARHIIRAAPAYEQYTTDMQAADIDGDGDIDLIVPDSGGPSGTFGVIFWFENPRLNTPAGFGADPRIGTNWVRHTIGTQGAVVHDMEIADLDNDGKLDVITRAGTTRPASGDRLPPPPGPAETSAPRPAPACRSATSTAMASRTWACPTAGSATRRTPSPARGHSIPSIRQ